MRIIIRQPDKNPQSPEAARPWMAYDDNIEAEHGVYGWGNTPREALDEFLKKRAEA